MYPNQVQYLQSIRIHQIELHIFPYSTVLSCVKGKLGKFKFFHGGGIYLLEFFASFKLLGVDSITPQHDALKRKEIMKDIA